MRTILRASAAVVAGLLLAFILVVALELFSAVVHPVPEDFGETMEEMCRHVERFPHWVLAVAVLAWAFTAYISTWTARRIGNLYSAAIVGLLLMAAVVFNISMLPYPIWFKIADLLAIPAAIVAGSRLLERQKSRGAAQANG